MSINEFYELTPVEFDEALKALTTLMTKDHERNFKTSMEVARYLAVHIWNSAGKSLKHPIRNIQEAFPFSWEEQKSQTIEEMTQAVRGIAAAFNTKKPKTRKRNVDHLLKK